MSSPVSEVHREATDSRTKIAGLSALLGAGILFLVAANGFFTYSGALLYVQETEYAILFAIAVQFAIGASLLALPFVRGLGKLAMLVVYVAALTLSTLSAFTYVYNASLPEKRDVHALGTEAKALISNKLSDALQQERTRIDEERQKLERLSRGVEEEVRLGLSSGLGPGKGPEYYRKLEEFQTHKTLMEGEEKRFKNAQAIVAEIKGKLAQAETPALRDELIVLFSSLRVELGDPQAKEAILRTTQEHLGVLKTPVERAYDAVVNPDQFSIGVVVSAVWAAMFDLIALFLGVIRYYLLRPSRSIFHALYEGLAGFYTFLLKLAHLRSDARGRFQRAAAINGPALNSTEMHAFATYLLAGSQLSQDESSNDPVEPLRTLLSHVEPLALEKSKNSVGIRFEQLEDKPRLNPLLAMLIQSGVLINDRENRCYVLNPATDMAQKVLVFIRIGMKNQPEQIDSMRFLLQGRGPVAVGAPAAL